MKVFRPTIAPLFTLDKVADTFLNMESWGKGMVWVNGHAMGRFWEIGPQASASRASTSAIRAISSLFQVAPCPHWAGK